MLGSGGDSEKDGGKKGWGTLPGHGCTSRRSICLEANAFVAGSVPICGESKAARIAFGNSGGQGLRTHKRPSTDTESLLSLRAPGARLVCSLRGLVVAPYFGGAGMNPSRLRPGSGLGLGFGAFLTSFLPLSLLPMRASVPQKGAGRKGRISHFYCPFRFRFAIRGPFRYHSMMCSGKSLDCHQHHGFWARSNLRLIFGLG